MNQSDPSRIAIAAAVRVTGRRWCQHGSHYAPAENVSKIASADGKGRDICNTCRANRAAGTGKKRSNPKCEPSGSSGTGGR